MTDIQTPKKPFKPSGLASKFEAPKYDLPTMEVPEVVREFAEKGVQQAKDAYDRIKTAAEEATNILEDTYATASKGVAEYNLKALEALRANTNASFDYAQQLMGVKTLSEAVELSASHVRKQFDALTTQSKELSTLVAKVGTDAAEPIKAGVSKTFKVQ
jgi:phasin